MTYLKADASSSTRDADRAGSVLKTESHNPRPKWRLGNVRCRQFIAEFTQHARSKWCGQTRLGCSYRSLHGARISYMTSSLRVYVLFQLGLVAVVSGDRKIEHVPRRRGAPIRSSSTAKWRHKNAGSRIEEAPHARVLREWRRWCSPPPPFFFPPKLTPPRIRSGVREDCEKAFFQDVKNTPSIYKAVW
jgi:hypothetical protein